MELRGLAAIKQEVHILQILQILIAVTYFFPPAVLMYFARKRREFRIHWTFCLWYTPQLCVASAILQRFGRF